MGVKMGLRKFAPRKPVGALFVAVVVAFMSAPTWAQEESEDEGKEFPEEPFFTARSFPESEVEFEVGYDNFDSEDEIELGLGISWEFMDNFQFGVELPFVIRNADDDSTVSDLGDVEISALWQISNLDDGFSFALLGEVAAPTGDEGKEIGGTGSWGIFGTGGFLVPLDSDDMNMGVQFQLGYEQQIDLTDEQREEALELGVSAVREKELVWGVALNTKLGALVPTFEVVGHTVLDAIDDDEEGTIVEVGGGVWWEPPDDSLFGGLVFGLAAKGPVTGMKESNYTVLFVVKGEY